jgi:hypothetical protein
LCLVLASFLDVRKLRQTKGLAMSKFPCLIRFCAASLIFAALAGGTAHAASVDAWRSDIDSIVKNLRATHPDPFTKTGRTTFLRQVAALETALPSLTDNQRLARTMRLIGMVQDNHTWLEPNTRQYALWYPIRMTVYGDGVFISGAHKSVAELAGAQILAIAGHPPMEVLEDASSLMGCDNDLAKTMQIFPAHNAAIMDGLGYTDKNGKLSLTLKLPNGEVTTRVLAPVQIDDATFEWRGRPEMAGPFIGTRADWIGAYRGLSAVDFRKPDLSRPLYFQARGANFYSHGVPEKDAYYIQIVWMHNSDTEGLVPFIQRAMKEIDIQKPKRLIVDLRHEGGGDGSKAAGIVEEFVKRKDNKPWRELYVLTGPACYSACNILLAEFLNHTDVTIVGEPEGAPQNSFGDSDIGLFNYPKTGMRMFVSTLWHQLSKSDDVGAYTPVDVPQPDLFGEYVQGRDSAIDKILGGEEMRSLSTIARSDGGAAAMAVYEKRKPAFSKYVWWTPAREDDLNDIGHDFMHANRPADAVNVFKLATEIFPYSWNTWDSLGEGELAARDKQSAATYYKRALELNPQDMWAQNFFKTGKPE